MTMMRADIPSTFLNSALTTTLGGWSHHPQPDLHRRKPKSRGGEELAVARLSSDAGLCVNRYTTTSQQHGLCCNSTNPFVVFIASDSPSWPSGTRWAICYGSRESELRLSTTRQGVIVPDSASPVLVPV